MGKRQEFGCWINDSFEEMFKLISLGIPFLYTNKFLANKFIPFDFQEQGRDKWRLKKWFKMGDVRFIDPSHTYNPALFKLTPIEDYWAACYSVFSAERFSSVKKDLATALYTLSDTGYITTSDIRNKIRDVKKQKVKHNDNSKSKRQSTLSSSVFGSAGREEAFGNDPFYDYLSGSIHKADGEKFIFENSSDFRPRNSERVPGEPGYLPRRGLEVLHPCTGIGKSD